MPNFKKKEKPITDGGYKKFKKETRKRVNKEFKPLAFAKKFKAKRDARKAFKKSYEEGSYQ